MAETKTQEKTQELPDVLTVEKAAGIVGPDKAEAFFNEVMFAGWGNLSGFESHRLVIKELVDAANDAQNSQRGIARDALSKVQSVFKDYQK